MKTGHKLLTILFSLIYLLVGGAYCYGQTSRGGQVLSLDSCIQRALEANYSIKIVRNEEQKANNLKNATPFLPKLSVKGGQNQNIANNKTITNQVTHEQDWVKTNQLSAGVALDWTLFDGMKMFVTRDKYAELKNLGELQTRAAIENLIVKVSSYYYEVVRQQSKVAAAKHSLNLSMMRYKEAYDKYVLGSLSGLEALQAKLDLNADSSNYMKEQQRLKTSYITLNTVMNVNLNMTHYVRDSINLREPLDFKILEYYLLRNNTMMQMSKLDCNISELDIKMARSVFFPQLKFQGGYNVSHTKSPDRATTLNNTNGPYWGFSVSMNIFDRLENRRKIKNARLDVENAHLSHQDVVLQIRSDFAQLYNTYTNNLLLVNFEKENSRIAFENLDAALEKYKLGSLAGIEFREFQRSYIAAVDREVSALFDAKISELSLLLISGRIMK